jgi:hypothetical protein
MGYSVELLAAHAAEPFDNSGYFLCCMYRQAKLRGVVADDPSLAVSKERV